MNRHSRLGTLATPLLGSTGRAQGAAEGPPDRAVGARRTHPRPVGHDTGAPTAMAGQRRPHETVPRRDDARAGQA